MKTYYYTSQTHYEPYLAHHGVKGMKWGVRKAKEQKATGKRIAKAARSSENRWYMDELDKDPTLLSVKKKAGCFS